MPDIALDLSKFPRFTLLEGATPIQRLARLSERLGVEIFVKRDDLMGLGGGGNKLRKLEFLIGEALAQGADTVITVGARQSNHARLTAAAAVRAGLACELVLTRMVPRDDRDYADNGNILLDELLGARMHDLPRGADALAFANERADALRAQGRTAYVSPLGGSSPVGCLGYAAAAVEILQQAADQDLAFDRIVLPNGSGGTQAGLVAALQALGRSQPSVTAYTVLAPLEQAWSVTRDKAAQTLRLIDPETRLPDAAVVIDGEHRGDGYGLPTDAMRRAVALLASTEGLLIDPVYGGKAFAGLLHDVERGHVRAGERVLFLMTGGLPGLFAYRSAF